MRVSGKFWKGFAIALLIEVVVIYLLGLIP